MINSVHYALASMQVTSNFLSIHFFYALFACIIAGAVRRTLHLEVRFGRVEAFIMPLQVSWE